jgi:hypothetical protein
MARGTTRLLFAVLCIDTIRNIVENVYFGLSWHASIVRAYGGAG